MTFENKIVRGGDVVELAFSAQNQRIVQNSRPLQNRAATGAAADYWDSAELAICVVDFMRNLIGITDDNEIL